MNRLLELAPGKLAHASGALWLPEQRAALLADVHLGYAWAQRRRGELGPLFEGGVRERLISLVEELNPLELVFLGDLVHAPRPSAYERSLILETLDTLRALTSLVLVLGNHDRGFVSDFSGCGVKAVDEWRTDDLLAVHGDRAADPGDRYLAIGHHHPAFGVRDAAGVKQKVPAFLIGRKTFVLPAFSPFAAGVDVTRGLSPELRTLFGRQPVQGVAATGRQAIAVGRVA